MEDISRFGDVRTVAAISGVSRSHLNKLRLYRASESPPFMRIGRKVLYPLTGPNSLESWIADRVKACSGARNV